MNLQKLPWAGIRVQAGATSVAIDPLYHFPAKYGESREPMYPLGEFGAVDAVLITHHHADHFDPEAIKTFYGADTPVFLPAETAHLAREAGLANVRGAGAGETFEIGSLRATAVPAVDGMGDPQVSWVVEGDGKRIFHGGDTLWHGYWWAVAAEHGPFDAACLPVNGAVLELPGRTPSGQPICLTPEQAVAAAVVLGAKRLVPIHYVAIHHPPLYRETSDIPDRLAAAARDRIQLNVLQAKETLRL